MKNFLTNNFTIIFSLIFILFGFYGINNPVGVRYELRKGSIIAKDSHDIKIGKNSFRKEYRFALKYEDIESEVISVNLAQYTEKEVGQSFERMIEHHSTSYSIIFVASCLFIFFGSITFIASLLFKF
jgi:hypothetical protein